MKKSLLFGVIGLAAGMSTAMGQSVSVIYLDNYFSGSNLPITFGYGGVPVNGVSGAVATPGTPLNSAWTVGLYFAIANGTIVDPASPAMPASPLALGTGTGSTVNFASPNVGGTPGYFSSSDPFITGLAPNTTITVEIVVYDAAASSYASAGIRAHSDPFTMTTVAGNAIQPNSVGDHMQPFSIGFDSSAYVPVPTPEPTTLMLSGLSGLSLILFRRRSK